MVVRLLDDVLAEVARRPAPYGLHLVAVDGPSGSGKSTLAARLAARAGSPVLPGDDFLSWPTFDGWWSRFRDQVLRPLRRGEDVRYQARDWEGDQFGTSLGEWKVLPWSPLVVVEGVTFGRRAAGDAFAYRIWVDAPQDVRLARGLARDGESHRALWLDWMSREQEFFAMDQTVEAADLRVDGAPAEPHDPETEVVLLGVS
jgi:hypothetical protein